MEICTLCQEDRTQVQSTPEYCRFTPKYRRFTPNTAAFGGWQIMAVLEVTFNIKNLFGT